MAKKAKKLSAQVNNIKEHIVGAFRETHWKNHEDTKGTQRHEENNNKEKINKIKKSELILLIKCMFV